MSSIEEFKRAGGVYASTSELEELILHISLPPVLYSILKEVPIIGVSIALTDEEDLSGLGVEMKWMTPTQMISEAKDVFPGILAIKIGYFPIGICLEGSGDPYFFRERDGAIVRIPHTAVSENCLNESQVEVVSTSVDEFINTSTVY